MKNYKIYLEMAGSEVRALESYSNFQMILDGSIESAMESTGEFINNIKERIIKFFKMIYDAIKRFFAKLFSKNNGKLYHKKSISAIREYTSKTKIQIVRVVQDILKYLTRTSSDMDRLILPDFVKETHSDIKDGAEKMKKLVHNYVITHNDKSEYGSIDESDLKFIEKDIKDCENVLEKIIHEMNTVMEPNNLILRAVNHNIINVLSTITTLSSTTMQLVQLSLWHSKVEE